MTVYDECDTIKYEYIFYELIKYKYSLMEVVMKKINKIISLIVAGVMAVSMTACSNKAEKTVETSFAAIKDGDVETFLSNVVCDDSTFNKDNNFLQIASEYIEYEIKSSEKTDNGYVVNMDISNIDVMDWYNKTVEANGEAPADDEVKYYVDNFVAGKALEFKTNNIDVDVIDVDGTLKINADKDFITVLYGSSVDAQSETTTN